MFEKLTQMPSDPILQLLLDCQADTNPNKVDLSVGVYKDPEGNTPIMASVSVAQLRRVQQETTKTYTGIAGDPRFNRVIPKLVLGNQHPLLSENRLSCIQTPGGSGALRIAAELIADALPGTQVWLSDPTWVNHFALFGNSGLRQRYYPYYDQQTHSLQFDSMCEALRTANRGDILVLHGSCHNPCGADLTLSQWRQLTQLILNKGLIPLIDVAYHGMADELDTDAQGWREMAQVMPEMIITYSCSKNFSMYRERTGALITIAETPAQASITYSNMLTIVRQIYSVPPAHGAAIVAEILEDAQLYRQWKVELEHMRNRIFSLRALLSSALNDCCDGRDFSFIGRERGMFSFLGITAEQAIRLRAESSVYLLNSSRINIAGVTEKNVDYIAQAIRRVL